METVEMDAEFVPKPIHLTNKHIYTSLQLIQQYFYPTFALFDAWNVVLVCVMETVKMGGEFVNASIPLLKKARTTYI